MKWIPAAALFKARFEPLMERHKDDKEYVERVHQMFNEIPEAGYRARVAHGADSRGLAVQFVCRPQIEGEGFILWRISQKGNEILSKGKDRNKLILSADPKAEIAPDIPQVKELSESSNNKNSTDSVREEKK